MCVYTDRVRGSTFPSCHSDTYRRLQYGACWLSCYSVQTVACIVLWTTLAIPLSQEVMTIICSVIRQVVVLRVDRLRVVCWQAVASGLAWTMFCLPCRQRNSLTCSWQWQTWPVLGRVMNQTCLKSWFTTCTRFVHVIQYASCVRSIIRSQ